MPCRAELLDEAVRLGAASMAALESIMPGCCWACREPISHRQDAVTYAGPNLKMPGRESPTFHTRADCAGSAMRYEETWLAEDPRRSRVLTWPHCDGTLKVHEDGSSECSDGGQPDCEGHLTHDHGRHSMCLTWGPCERGCQQQNHPGIRTSRRPKRRDREQQTL